MNIQPLQTLISMPTTPDGNWEFRVGYEKVFVSSPLAWKHFSTPGCKCHPVLILEVKAIFIGGEDDCPIHGVNS